MKTFLDDENGNFQTYANTIVEDDVDDVVVGAASLYQLDI
jgi:hypothetical protein